MPHPASQPIVQVELDVLRRAAAVAHTLADRLETHAGELSAVAAPLLSAAPGSLATESAGDAALRWGRLLDDEAREIRSLAWAVEAAIDDYRATDARLADAAAVVGRGGA